MNEQSARNMKRFIIFVFGLLIMSFGIALSIKSDLGTMPISSLPNVLSFGTGMSVGMLTILLHLVFLFIEILILRRSFYLLSLLQIPVTVVFGFFIDLSLWLISGLIPSGYLMQWILLIIGCIMLSAGVCLVIAPRLMMMASEGLLVAAFEKYGIPIEKSKITLDVALIIASFIISILMYSELCGVREGTIACSLMIAPFIKWFKKPAENLVKRIIE